MSDVTQESDGGLAQDQDAAVPEVTVEEAQRLEDEAFRLWRDSYAQGHAGDLAMAQSEAIVAILELRDRAATVEVELDQARDLHAKAVAMLDPVAAELEAVLLEISAIDPRAGNLDQRIAARQRLVALREEVPELQAKVAELQGQVEKTRELVRSYEADVVPLAQAELGRAVSALVSPPMDDLAKLVEVAPQTVGFRGSRIGQFLVTAETVRTPHAWHVLAALLPALGASGLASMLRDMWLSELKKKTDPQTYARARQAMKPDAEEYAAVRQSLVPGVPGPAREADPEALKRAAALAQLGGPPQADVLPGYESGQAARMRQARRGYRGPADWPSFNGVRAPMG